jgi:hypothetical protein
MSNNNNGTGFWVIVALMLVLSIVAIIEAAVRFVFRRIGSAHTASTQRRWRETALGHR